MNTAEHDAIAKLASTALDVGIKDEETLCKENERLIQMGWTLRHFPTQGGASNGEIVIVRLIAIVPPNVTDLSPDIVRRLYPYRDCITRIS